MLFRSGRKTVSSGRGQWAFGDTANFVDLSRRVARGAEIRQTNISEALTFEQFVDKYGERATPLFAVDQKSRVEVFTTDNTFVPKAGWVVLALVDPEREDARRAPAKAVSR